MDPVVNPSNAKTLNAYSYAQNNPVNFTDPTGMCTPSGEGCGGSAAATSFLMGINTLTLPMTVTVSTASPPSPPRG